MTTHAQARSDAREAFNDERGRDPSPPELEALTATSYHETSYGDGWKAGEGAGSNNMGAITGAGTAGSFEHKDSRPADDGSGGTIEYTTKFAADTTPVEGWRRLVRTLGAAPLHAIETAPSLAAWALAMYSQDHYFTGFQMSADKIAAIRPVVDYVLALDPSLGEQRAARVAQYAVALDKAADRAASSLGVPRAIPLLPSAGPDGKPLPVPWFPTTDNVRAVQHVFTAHAGDPGFPTTDAKGRPMTGARAWTGVPTSQIPKSDEDGTFGPRTEAVTAWWQAGHGLPVTRRIDEATYRSALGLPATDAGAPPAPLAPAVVLVADTSATSSTSSPAVSPIAGAVVGAVPLPDVAPPAPAATSIDGRAVREGVDYTGAGLRGLWRKLTTGERVAAGGVVAGAGAALAWAIRRYFGGGR